MPGIRSVLCHSLPKSAHAAGMCTGYSQGCQFHHRGSTHRGSLQIHDSIHRKESLTITILNRKGLEAAYFFCGCDMFRSLQKFSGEILNATGQSVRKIKKSELQKVNTALRLPRTIILLLRM